jgi:folate-binding protein YgfZ
VRLAGRLAQQAFAYDLRREIQAHMLNPAPTPYKDEAPAPARGALPEYSLLSCSGADAGAFLQAQTMNDVRALAPGQWHWNGWLSPKGRVICLFALWRRGEQDFLALLPDFPAVELLPLLQRYVFRSKARLAVSNEYSCAGELGAARGDGARDLAQAAGAGWRFDFGGDEQARALLLLPSGEAAPEASPEFSAAWRLADIAHGLPRLGADQREAWTPQMLSLQRLNAFSLGKGCYPGQEIVARTHYLGQARRELVRLQGEAMASGTPVTDAGGRGLGSVVCASADGRAALAVLPVEREAGLRAGSSEVLVAPMLEGLQRPL